MRYWDLLKWATEEEVTLKGIELPPHGTIESVARRDKEEVIVTLKDGDQVFVDSDNKKEFREEDMIKDILEPR
jgi:hypothetical protein